MLGALITQAQVAAWDENHRALALLTYHAQARFLLTEQVVLHHFGLDEQHRITRTKGRKSVSHTNKKN
jgi:hypothetical protein